MISLEGKTALITGSTQGVGRAIAIGVATEGGNVVLHGLHDDAAAQEALAECRSLGVTAELVTSDLLSGSTTRCVNSLFDQANAAIGSAGQIDLLVNNAGTYMDQPFLEMDFETFDRTMKLNVYSYFFLTQRFAKHWVENSIAGRVLLIGSINGRLAEPTHAAYDTSKGAVEMMVKSLCVSLAPHNIRVNGLAPGLFNTPLTAGALEDGQLLDWMKQHTPNGQVPGPEVCAEAAVYLLSDAARHVHGHMMLIDGGMSAWQQPDP
ncbi:SDR family oxidoreductase [bacterium]|nr:SDR family oxidoreductase [bacterium]